jgi:hypothetical protein
MKNLFFRNIVFFSIVSVLISGCHPSTKRKESKGTTEDGKQASVTVEIFDPIKIKDQIVETIQKIPDQKEVVKLLNESGASYFIDMTIPIKQSEKMLTKTDLSFGLGMYGFDLLYATTYNRGDNAVEISQVSEQIIDKLGLTGELVSSKNYLGRLKTNVDNKDSLDYLVTQDINHFNNRLAAGNNPDVYALSVIGSNVEALYILSQSTLLAIDNKKMLDIMSAQSQRVNLVLTLLELMSGDENVKPYYEQFKPVVGFFAEGQKITDTGLKQVVPLLESLRKNILK